MYSFLQCIIIHVHMILCVAVYSILNTFLVVVVRLLDMVRESFGADAARNVMAVEPDNLPIILIVFKSKGKVEVRNVIQGLSSCVVVCIP